MIKEGEEVIVVKSPALDELKLSAIVGLKGIVSKVCIANKTPGAFVHLNIRYMGSNDWYIPLMSLQNFRQQENRRKENIINQTFL